MDANTVAVDLAKSVFQVAMADLNWRVIETQRLSYGQFERWFGNRQAGLVVMECCQSALDDRDRSAANAASAAGGALFR